MTNEKVIIKTNIDKNHISRGKIYAFKKNGMNLIKRCIGIEGDHIAIKDNNVYLNGKLMKEKYVSSKTQKHISIDLVVPKNTLFFLGDNRAVSYDARFWTNKFIKTDDLIGEAIKIL